MIEKTACVCVCVCVLGGGGVDRTVWMCAYVVWKCTDVGVAVTGYVEAGDNYIWAYSVIYDSHSYVCDSVYFPAHFHKQYIIFN